nr:MAG TPA: PGDYG protein [Caudoviricetes sp.]
MSFFSNNKGEQMKYRKKPVVIEAVQFVDTEESILKLSELGLDPVRIDYADLDNPILKIETLEGLMIATEGDYIIKGVQGEIYPCKPDIFTETYEKTEE